MEATPSQPSDRSPLSLAWTPSLHTSIDDVTRAYAPVPLTVSLVERDAQGAGEVQTTPSQHHARLCASSHPLLSPCGAATMLLTHRHGEPLTGPGRVVRTAPGTAYRVGGARLVRTITFDPSGQAVLRLTPALPRPPRGGVRGEASMEPPLSAYVPPVPRRATQSERTLQALSAEVRAGSYAGAAAHLLSQASGGPAPPLTEPTMIATPNRVGDDDVQQKQRQRQQQQQSPDAYRGADAMLSSRGASTTASTTAPAAAAAAAASATGSTSCEAERAVAHEQEAFVAHLTRTYPLLKVLSPATTLEEHRYTSASTRAVMGVSGGEVAPMWGGASAPPPRAAAGETVEDAFPLSSPPSQSASRAASRTPARVDDGERAPSPTSSATAMDAASAPAVIRIGSSVDEPSTLRALAWGGCRPVILRAAVWRLLTGYAPASTARQCAELGRKRDQYERYARQYVSPAALEGYIVRAAGGKSGGEGGEVGRGDGHATRLSAYGAIALGGGDGGGRRNSGAASAALTGLAPHERAILSQLALDLPRHRAAVFRCDRTVGAMAGCLFLWAQRHPAVGYVQGMDDLLAMFFQVFLTDALRQRERERGHAGVSDPGLSSGSRDDAGAALGIRLATVGELGRTTADTTGHDLSSSLSATSRIHEYQLDAWTPAELDAALDDLPAAYLAQVAADTYGCADRVLSQLQDNFTRGQPGIVRGGQRLEAIVARADPTFARYLSENGLGVKEMCFQWLHCMLVRELPLPLCLMLWDTYLAVGDDEMAVFHVYVCAALVLAMRGLADTQAPMDVVVTALKNPYAYLFPKGQTAGAAGSTEVDTGLSKREREWITVLIADAYRLWRQYPP